MAIETIVKPDRKSSRDKEIEQASLEVARRYEQKRRKALESMLEQYSDNDNEK